MKKKICFIVSSPYTAKSFLMKHFEYLETNFEIYLVANFDENPELLNSFPPSIILKHVPIERNISILKDFATIFQLKNYLVANKFDAIHSVTPKAGLVSMIAGKWAGIKIRTHIFTGQVWHTKKGIFKYVLKKIDKIIVFFSTNILVDGKSQRDFLISNKVITEKNSKVLGKGSISGVDTNRFYPDEIKRKTYREKLGFGENEVVFMFLGRLNTDKGILDLAYSFQKLYKEHQNIKLLFVGFDEENLIPKVKEICPNNTVVFYGPTPVPEDVLQSGDVFCLPSYREGFGTSIIEASLLQKPIICSDTYGLTETIIDNQTGLRHKVKDVNGIYIQMKKMVQSKQMREEYGKSGREYVLNHFSVEMISGEWLKFYNQLLE